MKKTLTILILASLAQFACAEFPDRIFEVTADVGLSASNNYFPLSDMFQNPMVIDFNAMDKALQSDGFALTAGGTGELGINLRLSPQCRMGLFIGTDATGFTSLPKSLFDLISQGNTLDQTFSGNLDMRGDVFAEMGAWFGTRILGFDVTVRPAYYIPIIHVGNSSATYSMQTTSSGAMTANVQANVPVYSIVPLNSSIDSSSILANLLRCGGVDLTLGAEYPLFNWLALGVDLVHIPIILATLDQRTQFQYNASFSMNNLLANYSSNSLYQTSQSSSAVSDTDSTTVARPLDLGVHAVFYPFSTPILSLTPNIGMGIYDGTYMNGGLKAEMNFRGWFVFSLSSQFEDRLWNEQVGMALNMKLFEIDVLVGGQSSDFQSSFTCGVSASVGAKIGY